MSRLVRGRVLEARALLLCACLRRLGLHTRPPQFPLPWDTLTLVIVIIVIRVLIVIIMIMIMIIIIITIIELPPRSVRVIIGLPAAWGVGHRLVSGVYNCCLSIT